jgi:hypothetical protein
MRKPKKNDVERWVRAVAHSHHCEDQCQCSGAVARRVLTAHGLGLDGKPDPRIAADAAATGARLPRGTVRVS